MGLSKINDVTLENVSKVKSVARANIAKIADVQVAAAATFSDDYAVSRSLTEGSSQAVRIADGNGLMNYTQNTAFSVSFWVKVGWNASLNTNVHLFSSTATGSTNGSDHMIRCYYNEVNNRLYWEMRSSSSSTLKYNFWLFQANYSPYQEAYSAAGLGTSYWSNTNRGNTGDGSFTMITFSYAGNNSFTNANIDAYWNGTNLGQGFYANGNNSGTLNLSASTDRQIALGSNTWNYKKSGNDTESQYNDLTIWNKRLSDTEVSELYNEGTRLDATTHSAANDLEAYYKLENDGSDSSGNNHPSFEVNGNSNFVSI
tara:strand:- start:3580 stop:4521 length:942 start_codon:yes stop_codon:yes gene_type:complete